jgi:hypothetical protein
MSEKLATVGTFGTPEEAHQARNRLEAEGIQAHLADEAGNPFGYLGDAVHGIKLQVGEANAERAAAILQTHGAGVGPAPGEDEEDEEGPMVTDSFRSLKGPIIWTILAPILLGIVAVLLAGLVALVNALLP